MYINKQNKMFMTNLTSSTPHIQQIFALIMRKCKILNNIMNIPINEGSKIFVSNLCSYYELPLLEYNEYIPIPSWKVINIQHDLLLTIKLKLVFAKI